MSASAELTESKRLMDLSAVQLHQIVHRHLARAVVVQTAALNIQQSDQALGVDLTDWQNSGVCHAHDAQDIYEVDLRKDRTSY